MGQIDSKQIQNSVFALESENIIHHSQSQKFLHDFHTNDSSVKDVHDFEEDKLKMFLKYFIKNNYFDANDIEDKSKKVQGISQNSILEKKIKLESLKIILEKVQILNSQIKSKFQLVCQQITRIMIDKNANNNGNGKKLKHKENSIQNFIMGLLCILNLKNITMKPDDKIAIYNQYELNETKKMKIQQKQLNKIKQQIENKFQNHKQVYQLVQFSFQKEDQCSPHSRFFKLQSKHQEHSDNLYLIKLPMSTSKVSFFTINFTKQFEESIKQIEINHKGKGKLFREYIEQITKIFNILFSDMSQKKQQQKSGYISWIILKFFSLYENFKYKSCIYSVSKAHSSGFYEVESANSLSALFDEIYSASNYQQFSKDVDFVSSKIISFEKDKVNIESKISQFLSKLYKQKSIGYAETIMKTESQQKVDNSIIRVGKRRFTSVHNIIPFQQQNDKENIKQTFETFIVNKQKIEKNNNNNNKNKTLRRTHNSLFEMDTINLNHGFNLYNTDFNILEVEEERLKQLALSIFLQMNFIKNQSTKKLKKLDNFLTNIRGGYEQNNNSFHNFVHGVNVMHTSFLLCQPKKTQLHLSQFSQFILVLSALCHDVGHTGFNNAFQIATNSELAQRFNDISPLQNYHIARTLQLLKNEKSNFLDFLTKEQFTILRKLLISNILYTDIKQHFTLLKKFQQKKINLKTDDFQDEKLISGVLIHSSDFGGSAKQFSICQEWSRRVNQQFMRQSTQEQRLGLPLSPFMLNLQKPQIMTKNQFGFLKFMVQPLYKSMSEFLEGDNKITAMLNRINENVDKWQDRLKQLENQNQKSKNKSISTS